MKASQFLYLLSCTAGIPILWFTGCAAWRGGGASHVTLMTLDPGHFHAALVQKTMYPGVSSNVYVFAPDGPDVMEHLARIEGYNTRPDDPTSWATSVYTGPDYFEKMLARKPGNVVVISGRNNMKPLYIAECVDKGLNVLADKPMATTPFGFTMLRNALDTAAKRRLLVYDIMTERYEITTLLQRELSTMPGLFGMLETGSYDSPAVTKESVHHFSKLVSGSPLKRPAWFFDTVQQGEGIVDVTTHLVDLIQWECFPEQALDWQKDILVAKARRWPTPLSLAQFSKVTQLDSYPDYLAKDVATNGVLNVCANGEIDYTVRGIHAKVSVRWEFDAPAGAGDTHFSIMRGTKATLVIRQGAEQQYKPELYVEKAGDTTDDALESSVQQAIDLLQLAYPGVAAAKGATGWQIVIPDSYRTGHEAHFAQVTEAYLTFLADGSMPKWEIPNMLAKYYTTTTAYTLSR